MFIFMVFWLSVLLLFSSFRLWQYYTAEKQAEEQFNEVVEQIKEPPETNELPELPEVPEEQPPEWTVLDQYGTLFEQNPDMIGWIAIEDTIINYPVMQTPDNPNFYLKHNFEKAYSDYGVPYVSANCTINPPSDNITIFGHHMNSGKMFCALENYKSETFYHEHSIIRFDTRAGFGEYKILIVFKVNPADFEYPQFSTAENETEFDEYVRRCKALSFYDTGVTAEYGDKLITLSTCEYSGQNNRLVVVAKKIGGEPSG